jgi:hypothetical protein
MVCYNIHRLAYLLTVWIFRYIEYAVKSQLSPYFFKIHFIHHVSLGLPSYLFPSGFPAKTLYLLLFSPCVPHALPISSYLTLWLKCFLPMNTITMLVTLHFSSVSSYFLPLRPKYPPQHPVLNALSLCAFPTVSNQNVSIPFSYLVEFLWVWSHDMEYVELCLMK